MTEPALEFIIILSDRKPINNPKTIQKMRFSDMIYFQVNEKEKYKKQPSYNRISHIHSGFLDVRTGWRHKKRFLENHELLFVTKGCLFLALGDKRLMVRENEGILCSPFQTIQGYKTNEQRVSFYWVDFLIDQTSGIRLNEPKRIATSPLQFKQWLTDLCSLRWRRGVGEEVGDAALLLILTSFTRQYEGMDEKDVLVEQIREYIEEEIYHPLTVSQIAEKLQYDKDYLTRIVKSITGMTLKEYINVRRMEIAKSLLCTSSYKITQIAGIIGYENVNLFTKFFQYHEKVSPLGYRKMHMQ